METFQGTVEKLAFGGDGVLRADGLVVFIPFTAPGDAIEGRVTLQKKHYARGEIVRLLKAGPERCEPRCPYFGLCGGCQLQHVEYGGQLTAKEGMVAEAFTRIGKVANVSMVPIKGSSSPWRYRRHITLHLREKDGVFEWGYFALDNQTLLPVEQCVIFAEAGDPVFKTLQALTGLLKPEKGATGRVTLLKREEGGYLLALQFQKDVEGIKQVLESSSFAGIVVRVGNKVLGKGEQALFYCYGGLAFEFSPFSFIQNHHEQSGYIYEKILGVVNDGPVIDLYCGVGVSSLLLARKGLRVLGIESNPTAIELARRNGERLGVRAEFICGDAGKVFKRVLKEKKPEWVVANPPREGLDSRVLEGLCEGQVKGLVYVSCMPATLARDTERLVAGGYAVENCQAVDMFPQTGHVESAVVYRKKFP